MSKSPKTEESTNKVADTPARPSRRSRRGRQPVEMTGTVTVNSRGFGFLSTGAGPDLFLPESALRGILDGDFATAHVLDGSVAKVSVLARRRDQVVVDGNGGSIATVDTAIGSLSVELNTDLPAGHCALVTLDGQVLRQLGPSSSDTALAWRMLQRHRLPFDHSKDSLEQAATARVRTGRGRRYDLRDQLVITIDSDTSVDLDDALSASPGPDGSIRVWVHIADVAQHIHPGSPVDAQAVATPTSVYLPTYVRHMLPQTLSGGALSLLPGQDRDTLTCEMRIDAEGNVVAVDVYEAVIRSRRRLSYTTVSRALSQERVDLAEDEAHLLRVLQAAAIRLGRLRYARGGVSAGRIDPEPAGVQGEDSAHMLVERLMVATNEAVAKWCSDRGIPVLYRTHAALDAQAVRSLESAAQGLGLFAGLPDPITPQAFAALAEQAEQAGVAREFWDAAAALLARAKYTTVRSEHFGLGSPAYCHFTSPLRRYADLLMHRVVKEYLAGSRSKSAYTEQDLESFATVINDVTRAASMAERDARRAASLMHVKARQVFDATVVGVAGKNVKVLVHSKPATTGFLGKADRYAIGDRLRVRVRSVDALRGQLSLTPVDKNS